MSFLVIEEKKSDTLLYFIALDKWITINGSRLYYPPDFNAINKYLRDNVDATYEWNFLNSSEFEIKFRCETFDEAHHKVVKCAEAASQNRAYHSSTDPENLGRGKRHRRLPSSLRGYAKDLNNEESESDATDLTVNKSIPPPPISLDMRRGHHSRDDAFGSVIEDNGMGKSPLDSSSSSELSPSFHIKRNRIILPESESEDSDDGDATPKIVPVFDFSTGNNRQETMELFTNSMMASSPAANGGGIYEPPKTPLSAEGSNTEDRMEDRYDHYEDFEDDRHSDRQEDRQEDHQEDRQEDHQEDRRKDRQEDLRKDRQEDRRKDRQEDLGKDRQEDLGKDRQEDRRKDRFLAKNRDDGRRDRQEDRQDDHWERQQQYQGHRPNGGPSSEDQSILTNNREDRRSIPQKDPREDRSLANKEDRRRDHREDRYLAQKGDDRRRDHQGGRRENRSLANQEDRQRDYREDQREDRPLANNGDDRRRDYREDRRDDRSSAYKGNDHRSDHPFDRREGRSLATTRDDRRRDHGETANVVVPQTSRRPFQTSNRDERSRSSLRDGRSRSPLERRYRSSLPDGRSHSPQRGGHSKDRRRETQRTHEDEQRSSAGNSNPGYENRSLDRNDNTRGGHKHTDSHQRGSRRSAPTSNMEYLCERMDEIMEGIEQLRDERDSGLASIQLDPIEEQEFEDNFPLKNEDDFKALEDLIEDDQDNFQKKLIVKFVRLIGVRTEVKSFVKEAWEFAVDDALGRKLNWNGRTDSRVLQGKKIPVKKSGLVKMMRNALLNVPRFQKLYTLDKTLKDATNDHLRNAQGRWARANPEEAKEEEKKKLERRAARTGIALPNGGT